MAKGPERGGPRQPQNSTHSETLNDTAAQDRAALVQRAQDTIADNIRGIGAKPSLQERLLGASRNPMRLTGIPTDFDEIKVSGILGASRREGSLFLKPYMTHKPVVEGNIRMNVQNSSIHLEALGESREERIEAAEQIWSGVAEDQKVALAQTYIEWKKLSEQAGLEELQRAVTTQPRDEYFINQYAGNIMALTKLEFALAAGSYSIEMDDRDASLIISPTKVVQDQK